MLNFIKNYIGQFILFAFALFIGVNNYYKFEFTSDGFHYYSTIQNIIEGIGPYEGPTFQHIFGTHSYLIFYLLTPFVYIFNSPIVMLFFSATSMFVSSIILFHISRYLLNNQSQSLNISRAISISFFIFSITYANQFFDYYMFQPDTFLAPLTLFIFYSVIRNRFTPVLISTVLILLVKEEFIVIYPAIITLFLIIQYHFNIEGLKWNKRKIAALVFSYLAISLVSILVLFHYQDLNTNTHAHRELQLSNFGVVKFLPFFKEAFNILCPILPLLFLLPNWSKIKRPQLLQNMGLMLLVIMFRLTLNIIVYDDVEGKGWVNNIIAPLLYLLLILSIKISNYENVKMNMKRFILAFCSFFILSMIYNYPTPTRFMTQNTIDEFLLFKTDTSLKDEMSLIRSKISHGSGNEYIILPSYTMYPFMERSHVEIRKVNNIKEPDRKNKIINDATYVLFKKNGDITLQTKESIEKLKTQVLETNNYYLYE